MKKLSTGILVYRIKDNVLQVLLAHAGGPFWAKKDEGAWSIFKGEPEDDEDLMHAAKREFAEETGQTLPETPLLPLGEFKRKDGKVIHAWAIEQDYDPKSIQSNTFEMEWPPRSGKLQKFPENDRAEWFEAVQTPLKMFQGQHVFVERLMEILHAQNVTFETEGPDEAPTVQPTLF